VKWYGSDEATVLAIMHGMKRKSEIGNNVVEE
jgi:hypothetical protein